MSIDSLAVACSSTALVSSGAVVSAPAAASSGVAVSIGPARMACQTTALSATRKVEDEGDEPRCRDIGQDDVEMSSVMVPD